MSAVIGVNVGALAVAIEDHDEFRGSTLRREGMGRHRGELGRLAGLDDQLAFTEQQLHAAVGDEEPIVAGMHLELGRDTRRLQSHLDRGRGAGRPAQHPRRDMARVVRTRTNDDVVIGVDIQQSVQVDLERSSQRDENVEADRALAGLDATDRRCTEVRSVGDIVERQPERVAQAAQSRANDTLHVGLLGQIFLHQSSDLANAASPLALCERISIVDDMKGNHPQNIERRCDVAVVGGSAAGLAAALQLGRQRRSVIVIDSGEPRNAPATRMHSYLGQEGRPPGEFIATAREEVRSYGCELLAGRATDVSRIDSGLFRVDLAGGNTIVARRVLAATGLIDELPDIDGLAQHWGSDAIHCPFCHGYEVRDQRIAQIITHPMGLHSAGLFRQLTDQLTLILHDGVDAAHPEVEALRGAGAAVIDRRVQRVVADEAGRLVAVELDDHRRLETDALAISSRFRVRAEPFTSLDIALIRDPSGLGDVIETDSNGETSASGVYAAGNVTDPRQQVLQAAANGSSVGGMICLSLAHEDIEAAERLSPHQADWEHRYRGDPIWSGNPNGTLVREVGSLRPGRALDVGAGEGGDAVWLAEHGWTVTAADIARAAVDRITQIASDRDLTVEPIHADANARGAFDNQIFELVTAHYSSIPRTPDRRAVDNVIEAVAPGGTLLVVGHDIEAPRSPDGTTEHTHPFDPHAFVRVDDFLGAIEHHPEWHVVTHAKRQRPPGSATASHHVDDIVLRAYRRSA